MPTVEVLGVHPVETEEDVYLVEVIIRDATGRFDIVSITQAEPGVPRSDWQAPYDEKILDEEGRNIQADPWEDRDDALWQGDVRLAFFFHFLDHDKPLGTPFGDVGLPAPTPRPERLDVMEYEPP